MAGKITKDMTFGELLQTYPETVEILFRHGFHCIGCHMAATETIEQGAIAHGMSEEEIAALIKEMNGLISKKGVKK